MLHPLKKRAAVLLSISTVAAVLAGPVTAAPAAPAPKQAPLRWTDCATPATRRSSALPSRSPSTTTCPPGARSPSP